MEKQSSLGISWAEVVEARNRREDEGVARRFAQWAYLGRGHMREDLCRRAVMDRVYGQD